MFSRELGVWRGPGPPVEGPAGAGVLPVTLASLRVPHQPLPAPVLAGPAVDTLVVQLAAVRGSEVTLGLRAGELHLLPPRPHRLLCP